MGKFQDNGKSQKQAPKADGHEPIPTTLRHSGVRSSGGRKLSSHKAPKNGSK